MASDAQRANTTPQDIQSARVSQCGQIGSGAIKAYAVSANERLATPPDVPTAKEAGVNYQMSIWAGIFAPKGTPKAAVDKLAAALNKALDDASVKKRLADLGGIGSRQGRADAGQVRELREGGNRPLVSDPQGGQPAGELIVHGRSAATDTRQARARAIRATGGIEAAQ
jgi:Tripartite tricarboxylate transporter family receptor